MKDPRTREEIDTLLSLFHQGGSGDAGPSSDLLRPPPLVPGARRLLEGVLAEVARRAAPALTARLRGPAACRPGEVSLARAGAWLQGLGENALVVVARVRPLSLPCLVSLPLPFLHASVDRVLGGRGEAGPADQELSDAEAEVAETVWRPILDRLVEGLEHVGGKDVASVETCAPATLASRLPAHEALVVLGLQVEAGSVEGEVQAAVPLASIRDTLPGREAGADPAGAGAGPASRALMERHLRDVQAELVVGLGEARLALRDVMGLRPGDVLRLDAPSGGPLTARVEGVPKLRGRVGNRGGRLAFKVEGLLRQAEGPREGA